MFILVLLVECKVQLPYGCQIYIVDMYYKDTPLKCVHTAYMHHKIAA